MILMYEILKKKTKKEEENMMWYIRTKEFYFLIKNQIIQHTGQCQNTSYTYTNMFL